MSEKLVLEQPKIIRIFHWSFVGIITTKIFTGLYLAFPVPETLFKYIRTLHFYFAYFLLFWLVARIYIALVTGDYNNFIPKTEDIKNIPGFFKYELFLTSQKPPQGKYNIGQKIIFLSWVLVVLFQLLTGFALYDATLSKPIDLLVRGYNYIHWYHFLATLYLVATVTLHIYLAFTTDMQRMKAIFTGFIVKKQPN